MKMLIMKPILTRFAALLLTALGPVLHAAQPPNIVFIFVDDLGYADIGAFGSTKNRTPQLDRMAGEGMKLTSFYAAPVCSPSRLQAMTGCFAPRVGLGSGVYFPGDAHGINAAEHTVAELLKAQGYATMCVGKWHLGDQPEFLPTRHGFDDYFGLPYSNDMPLLAKGTDELIVPLMRGEKVAELLKMEDQASITERYTDEAVKFITANQSRPFFLYLPHTAVHWPIHPGKAFRGRSQNGLYGDWVEEVDFSAPRDDTARASCGNGAKANSYHSEARRAGKKRFLLETVEALKAYQSANSNQFPPSTAALEPYFKAEVDRSALARYQVRQLPNASSDGQLAKGQMVLDEIAPVDHQFDSHVYVTAKSFYSFVYGTGSDSGDPDKTWMQR